MKSNDGTDDIADDDAICKINKKKKQKSASERKKSPINIYIYICEWFTLSSYYVPTRKIWEQISCWYKLIKKI